MDTSGLGGRAELIDSSSPISGLGTTLRGSEFERSIGRVDPLGRRVDPPPFGGRQHGRERVVSTPEVMKQCRRGMQGNQSEQGEAHCLVQAQERLRQLSILLDEYR